MSDSDGLSFEMGGQPLILPVRPSEASQENSIERVLAYYRWTQMLHEEPTPDGLVKFHTSGAIERYHRIRHLLAYGGGTIPFIAARVTVVGMDVFRTALDLAQIARRHLCFLPLYSILSLCPGANASGPRRRPQRQPGSSKTARPPSSSGVVGFCFPANVHQAS